MRFLKYSLIQDHLSNSFWISATWIMCWNKWLKPTRMKVVLNVHSLLCWLLPYVKEANYNWVNLISLLDIAVFWRKRWFWHRMCMIFRFIQNTCLEGFAWSPSTCQENWGFNQKRMWRLWKLVFTKPAWKRKKSVYKLNVQVYTQAVMETVLTNSLCLFNTARESRQHGVQCL